MDNPPYKLQRIVNSACIMFNKPVVFCFVQKFYGRFFFVDGSNGCVDCLFQIIMSHKNYDYMKAFYNIKNKLVTATTTHSVMSICSIIINHWIKIITNNKKTEKGNVIFKINLESFKVKETVQWNKEANCVTCGDQSVSEKYLNEFFNLTNFI